LKKLELKKVQTDKSLGGNARISVHYCGLNLADIFACLGLYSATPEGDFTPGLEFSGIIQDIDETTSAWKIGDRVCGLTRFGGYSETIDIDPWDLIRVPEQWSLAEGASFPVQAITAWYGLIRLGNLQQGHVCLIHSAAGGVGLHAMQI